MTAKRNIDVAEEKRYANHDADESLWTSPAKESNPMPQRHVPIKAPAGDAMSGKEAHEARLRQELASVRKVNEALEGVLGSLERAKDNMKSVNQVVGSASSLLNIWTRILSQTEHNQRLVLDPTWQGANQDIADMEGEAAARQQAAERQEEEEQERRAAASRKAEEEEIEARRRADAPAAKSKSTMRGRTGFGRGSSAVRTGYVGTSTTSSNTTRGSVNRGGTNVRRTTTGPVRGTRGAKERG